MWYSPMMGMEYNYTNNIQPFAIVKLGLKIMKILFTFNPG